MLISPLIYATVAHVWERNFAWSFVFAIPVSRIYLQIFPASQSPADGSAGVDGV
jgi:hypothetical protein